MESLEMIEELNKIFKKREERDNFYHYMSKARKLNVHEDYIEHVYQNIKIGNDISFAIELASEDLDL
jgi:hypothetical protein